MPTPLLREKSLSLPAVDHPFRYDLHLPWYRKLQMAIATVTIVPIRIIFMVLCLLTAWAIACIILIGMDKDDLTKRPLSGWRKRMRGTCQFWCKASFACFGFYWRKIGVESDQSEAVALTMAPHSTLYDVMAAIILNELPYAIAKAETKQTPIIGKLSQLAQPIYVYREEKDSRHKTIAELKERAHSNGKWPQFIIFPEGTTSNRQALISFKAGAFIPGLPVQPVVLRYPDEWDSVTWTWEGPGALMSLWMCMCKLWNTLEVEFLPVYIPNEAERNDPYLYGENVRNVMAKALGIPVTEHSFEDCRLMENAKKVNLQMGDALIEFRKMQKKLGLTFDDVAQLLDKFSVISNLNGNRGRVDIDTFSQYMAMSINDALTELFDMFDRDGSGHIDFREYVIGMSLIAGPASADDSLQLTFDLFDINNKGYVLKSEFTSLMVNTLQTSESNADNLFDKVDITKTGKITFDDFKVFAVSMPEYAAFFSVHTQRSTGSSDNLEKPVIEQSSNVGIKYRESSDSKARTSSTESICSSRIPTREKIE